MAVHVNIPGIGQIEAAGAAEEQTLRQLLSVMSSSANRNRRADSDMANMLRSQGAAADDASKSMSGLANSSRMAGTSTSSYYSQLQDNLSQTNSGFSGLGQSVAMFGAGLIATGASIAANWAKTIGSTDIANPIKTTVDSMNMAMNMGVVTVGQFGKAVGGGAKLLGLDKIGRGLGHTGDQLAKFSGQVMVGLNSHMANELGQTVKSMGEFAKMGGTFTGGATEMRNMASASGLTLDQFTRVVKDNRDKIGSLNMGIVSGADAVSKSLGYMNVATSDSSKTGRTFRNELRAMGYEVEEQAGLTAQYISNMKAGMTQDQMRNVTIKQISEGTMEYAKNLKIVSDFTGKDAKAAMDRARQESQKADIMAKLQGDPEKLAKFQAVYASTPDSMKKGLLEMVSTGGVIVDQSTNQMIAQNGKAGEALQQGYRDIMDGSKKVADTTVSYQTSIRQAANSQKALAVAGDGTVAMVSRLTGAHQGLSDMQTDLMNAAGDPTQPKKTAEANENMLKSMDPVTQGYIKAADASQQFAVYLQNLATRVLPNYSKVIGDSAVLMTTVISAAMATLAGDKSGGQLAKEVSDSYKKFQESIKTMLSTVPRRAEGGIVNGGQLSVIGEAGPEAIIPLSGGRSVPVEFSGKGLKQDTSSLAQKNQNAAEAISADKMPEIVTTAMQTLLSGPAGFASVMSGVAGQLASDNKEQLTVMQDQLLKMNDMLTALQDNARASDRISYGLT